VLSLAGQAPVRAGSAEFLTNSVGRMVAESEGISCALHGAWPMIFPGFSECEGHCGPGWSSLLMDAPRFARTRGRVSDACSDGVERRMTKRKMENWKSGTVDSGELLLAQPPPHGTIGALPDREGGASINTDAPCGARVAAAPPGVEGRWASRARDADMSSSENAANSGKPIRHAPAGRERARSPTNCSARLHKHRDCGVPVVGKGRAQCQR